jgi:predicted ATPase
MSAPAEGNPLFVEEMLSMLIEKGLLVRAGGRWAANVASVPVPRPSKLSWPRASTSSAPTSGR